MTKESDFSDGTLVYVTEPGDGLGPYYGIVQTARTYGGAEGQRYAVMDLDDSRTNWVHNTFLIRVPNLRAGNRAYLKRGDDSSEVVVESVSCDPPRYMVKTLTAGVRFIVEPRELTEVVSQMYADFGVVQPTLVDLARGIWSEQGAAEAHARYESDEKADNEERLQAIEEIRAGMKDSKYGLRDWVRFIGSASAAPRGLREFIVVGVSCLPKSNIVKYALLSIDKREGRRWFLTTKEDTLSLIKSDAPVQANLWAVNKLSKCEDLLEEGWNLLCNAVAYIQKKQLDDSEWGRAFLLFREKYFSLRGVGAYQPTIVHPPEETKAKPSFVDEALNITRKNREGIYGKPSKNFETTAKMLEAWINARPGRIVYGEVKINTLDIADIMCILKLARLANQPLHRDSRVDLVGYTDCADRIIEEMEANSTKQEKT